MEKGLVCGDVILMDCGDIVELVVFENAGLWRGRWNGRSGGGHRLWPG